MAGWEYLGGNTSVWLVGSIQEGVLQYGWLGVFRKDYFGMAGWEYLGGTTSIWLVGSI